MLDYYGIGVATYPMTMGEYYSMQESMSHASGSDEGEGETVNIDMDEQKNKKAEE